MDNLRRYIDIISENGEQRTTRIYTEWVEKVTEAPTKTKTQTQTQTQDDLDNLFKQQHHDIAQMDSDAPTQQPKINPKRATGPAKITGQLRGNPDYNFNPDAMGTSEYDDDLGDFDMPQQHVPTRNKTDTPQLATTALTTANRDLATVPTELTQYVQNIDWTNLTSLPGHASQMIRNMGRRVFKGFGDMELEDIDTISTMTNSDAELDAVTQMVTQYGAPVIKEAEIDFGDVMPGYTPTISIWELAGRYYKFVKDDHGDYIYTWEHQDTNMISQWEQSEKEGPAAKQLGSTRPAISNNVDQYNSDDDFLDLDHLY